MQQIDTANRFVPRRNDWESAFFGREIWTLALCPSEGRTAIECMRDVVDADIWECRLPIFDSATIEQLTSVGFFVCDSSRDFMFDLSDPNTCPEPVTGTGYSLHVASAGEIPDVEALIGDGSFATRFARCPFSPADGTRFYRMWVRKAVLGEFDDLCCVAARDGRIAGFVTLRAIAGNESRVGLMFTRPETRRLGVANVLFANVARIARARGSRSLHLATQMTNESMLSLCTRMSGKAGPLHLHMYGLKADVIR